MITSNYQFINNVALISSLELLLSLILLSANLHKMINPNNIITNIPLRLIPGYQSDLLHLLCQSDIKCTCTNGNIQLT